MKRFFPVILLWFGLSASATASPLPPDGQWLFDVFRGANGVHLGQARQTWKHEGDRYAAELKLLPNKAIAKVYRFNYQQQVEGVLSGNGMVPERFWVTQKGRDPQTVDFDWENTELTITRRGKTNNYPLAQGTLDILSAWFFAATSGVETMLGEHVFVTNSRQVNVSITYVGEETLQLPIGKVDARHLRVRGDNDKIRLEVWLAQTCHNMPVRLLLTDKYGGQFDVQLRK